MHALKDPGSFRISLAAESLLDVFKESSPVWPAITASVAAEFVASKNS
jgi:hypothetical protein